MLHTRVAHVDTSSNATSQSKLVGVPPARYAGVHYKFSDPTQTATISLLNKGNLLFQQVGASDTDALKPYDQTKQPEPITGEILVVVETISASIPGATLDVSILVDLGGAG